MSKPVCPTVELISYTPDARELLLFTKQTRLTKTPGMMEQIKQWPEDRKNKELHYMLGTIQSSWEFVDYVFLIDGVSRAFTHQFVRTRTGSYAQQSQRTVDMEGFDYVVPDGIKEAPETLPGEVYCGTMNFINQQYAALIELGVNPQDARAILPTNVATNIIAKFNLRTLSDMAKKRLCTRTQGEYQQIFRMMRNAVIAVHPWAEPFIRVACAADGVCQFPNYKECPIKGGVFNPDTGVRWDGKYTGLSPESLFEPIEPMKPLTKDEIQKLWEETKFEAVPMQGEKT